MASIIFPRCCASTPSTSPATPTSWSTAPPSACSCAARTTSPAAPPDPTPTPPRFSARRPEDADIEDPGQAVNRADDAPQVCGNREWISWRVAQKYFFDPNFGGAVVTNGPRDILTTTLDFSGISFLTGPRNISPIISRLRVRPSDKVDLEWDFDYDTCSSSSQPALPGNAPQACQNKFTSNNVYVDVHQGNIVGGLSYARLDAPARSYVDGVLSSVADFDQMRVPSASASPPSRASARQPAPASTSTSARCSTARSRPRTTGTAAASASSTASTSWARHVTTMATSSTSPWPISAAPATCATPTRCSRRPVKQVWRYTPRRARRER